MLYLVLTIVLVLSTDTHGHGVTSLDTPTEPCGAQGPGEAVGADRAAPAVGATRAGGLADRGALGDADRVDDLPGELGGPVDRDRVVDGLEVDVRLGATTGAGGLHPC